MTKEAQARIDALNEQVPSLLDLLVQKYKYWRCSARIDTLNEQVQSLLDLLVQKYKYWRSSTQKLLAESKVEEIKYSGTGTHSQKLAEFERHLADAICVCVYIYI